MRSKPWSFALVQAFLVVGLILVLAPDACAKPKFKVLHTVSGGMFSSLTLDANGNLYGVTNAGGAYNDGTIFELKRRPNGKWSEIVVHSFNDDDGLFPNGGMIFDRAGNLYGTTKEGGATYAGTVFELTPGRDSLGWTYRILYNFCPEGQLSGCPHGGRPQAGVVIDRRGDIYGTAEGGSNGGGVAYELTPGGSVPWSYSVLHDFGPPNRGGDGSGPTCPLTLDESANLYGTTGSGGAYNAGTVFELGNTLGGWDENLLYSFCSGGFPCRDGAGPFYGLAFDSAGNFYGTTPGGGANNCSGAGCGAVFRLKPDGNGGWRENVLYSFRPGESGSYADSPVIFDRSGALYGTTAVAGIGGCGGYGCGVIYKLTPGAPGKWKYTVLHKFNGADGANPGGGLTLDSKGHLYGTAYSTVFEITP